MADDGVPFPYMRWAKAHLVGSDPLSLGLSGLARPGRDELPDIENPFEGGGDPEGQLPRALGARYGLPPEAVRPTAGASHANFLAYLAFARGGTVAVETPAYEAFPRLADAVGATSRAFCRRPETGWRIDLDDLARAVEGGVDLLAVTDLHNPSGKRLHPDDMVALLEAAEAHDALVLVDEVYLDLDPRDRPSAATLSPRVLVTSSLTKSHGMWDLRAGWVFGDPARIEKIAAWDDLVCPRLPQLALREILRFLPYARERLLVTRRRCAEATDEVDAWVETRDDVWWVRPDAGFTGFLRMGTPDAPLDGDEVAKIAWEQERVRVVPGSFFQTPHWIRISYLLADDNLTRSLAGLGRALDTATATRVPTSA